MPTICAFDHLENKHTLYHEKNCMKKFCKSLRKYAKNVVDFEKKIVTIHKNSTKITTTCKGMLHLWKEDLKEFL